MGLPLRAFGRRISESPFISVSSIKFTVEPHSPVVFFRGVARVPSKDWGRKFDKLNRDSLDKYFNSLFAGVTYFLKLTVVGATISFSPGFYFAVVNWMTLANPFCLI